MHLSEFRPKSQLVVSQIPVLQPRFPVVDAHNHLGPEFGNGWSQRPASELVDRLDEAGVRMIVDLDGGWGESILQERLDKFKTAIPEQYAVFGGVDWQRWPELGDRFGEWAVKRLEEQVRWGAQGLKIWKNLGLHVRDQHDRLVAVDDERLDPLWAKAGELHIPVLVHIADPVAFFEPIDETNERWEELHAHPDWQFPSPPFPSFHTLVEAMARVVKRHPQTIFIGAHVGWYAENLTWVSQLLEQAPNFYVDISQRLAELGRQPYTARRFFLEFSDRILFGIDAGPDLEEYRLYYRFLETDDEYFDYSPHDIPPQGRWRIYGVYLPDDALEKIYYQNALRLFSMT